MNNTKRFTIDCERIEIANRNYCKPLILKLDIEETYSRIEMMEETSRIKKINVNQMY